jgi:hypothetical protein
VHRFFVIFVCLFLSLWSAVALAQTDLTWSYTQNAQRPATSFVMQRCQVVPPATACTNMSDLPGGAAIPVTTTTFSDTTPILNVAYCYQVMAADTTGRSTPSNTLCAGKFVLNSPGTLSGTVR